MIGSTVNSATYAGNGSTSTAYVIPFRYDASSWVKVTVTNALGEIEDLEQVTDYTLAGTGSTANGTFTTTAAISSTSTVSVYREAPGTQTLSLPANTALPAVAVEAQLDRLAMAAADSVSRRALEARLSALLIAAGVNITTDDLLALLEDQDVEVASIGLTDGTGTAPKPGNLCLNADGSVVVGSGPGPDGESNAEDLPYLVNSNASNNFAKFVGAASMQGAAPSVLLARFPLKIADLTNGKILNISGKLQQIWTTGAKPDGGVYLTLCKAGEPPATSGFYFNFAEGVTSEIRNVCLFFAFSVASSTWTLNASSGSSATAFVTKNNAGTITHAAGWVSGTDLGVSGLLTGAAGEPVELELYFVSYNTSATVVANSAVSGNLSATIQ